MLLTISTFSGLQRQILVPSLQRLQSGSAIRSFSYTSPYILSFPTKASARMAVESCVNASAASPLPSSARLDNTRPKPKLHGRAFYESIGKPRLVLAPMVDQSEFAWRMLCRSFLPDAQKPNLLSYTPMFHARLFQMTPKNRDTFFRPLREAGIPSYTTDDLVSNPYTTSSSPTDPGAPFLDGNPSIDRPLIVQFCANDADELLRSARLVQPFCDAVDINLGCPQGIARKGRYGAFLQEDWPTIRSMISKLHNELAIPVTAKLRILDSPERTLEYAQMLLDAGASWLTLHGRRREQKGHLTGLADWTYIRYLRDHLPPDTVIFANGNILEHGDLEECLAATGADAVMSAEGCLANPAIFAPPVESSQDFLFDPKMHWFPKENDGENLTDETCEGDTVMQDHSSIGVRSKKKRRERHRGGWRVDSVVRRYLDIIYKYVLETEPPVRPELYVPHRLATIATLPTASVNAEVSLSTSDSPATVQSISLEHTQCRPSKRQKVDVSNGVTDAPASSNMKEEIEFATSTVAGNGCGHLESQAYESQAALPSKGENLTTVGEPNSPTVAIPASAQVETPVSSAASGNGEQVKDGQIQFQPQPPTQPEPESKTPEAARQSKSQAKRKAEKFKTPTDPSLRAMQAHLFSLIPRRMLTLYPEEVRSRLARSRAGDMEAFEDFSRAVDRAVEEGMKAYEEGRVDMYGEDTHNSSQSAVAAATSKEEQEGQVQEKEEGMEKGEENGVQMHPTAVLEPQSSEEARLRCRRAWWICQPYVRPLPAEALLKGALTAKKA